ncbi:hypothetical protein [Heyndrickxia oleronia]|uniref:hypothetical protein n=1 Tax=Heyndrickxia oleronia TaxID=38875 RepID=UPI001B089F16|nr:hypothetical protein [Heyndrickxia oleronia]GIN39413.1 hypothetical protein J19TS1_23620 [Heyndrickxia oleronia]
MFFKLNERADKVSVNIAFYCTFIYWACFLLINSILDLFNKGIEINSFLLLITGLVVFFVSELLSKYIRKKNKTE